MEQNTEAILEQLRGESDHSKSLVMAADHVCVLAIQRIQKAIPLVAIHLALICITCNFRYDLAGDADSAIINVSVWRLSLVLGSIGVRTF